MAKTKAQALAFYRDLCGVYNGNANRTCCGIASAEHIAQRMQLTAKEAAEYCKAMLIYGITERQGGKYVI